MPLYSNPSSAETGTSLVSILVSFTHRLPQIDLSDLPARPSRYAGGVGLSGPALRQFASNDEETAFWRSVMNPGTYEGHGNLTMHKDVGFL